MIFYGKQHPLFSSYVESSIIDKIIYCDASLSHRSMVLSKKELQNGKKYFIHPGLPLVDRSLDIEYIFNFEDQCTLYRFAENGYTFNSIFVDHPETDYIRYALEDSRCKKIICHVKKMADALPNLVNSNKVAEKTFYEKVGIDLKTDKIIPKEKGDTITILFTNSYHNWEGSFYLRGGHILVRAFNLLSKKHKNIKLILRTNIPKDYGDIMLLNNDQIEIIKDPLTKEELEAVYKRSDMVVLPAARVHSHSLCQALSFGIPVITTNGWGIEEFIKHEETGLIVKGFEKVSWHDNNVGCIEDYRKMNLPSERDPRLQELHFYIDYLIENPDALNILKENCLYICEKKYSLSNWEKWKI